MIPIVINNFNRLSTTKKLVEQLFLLDYTDVTILDNNSTYSPLLEWYKTLNINVHLFGENYGPLAIYNSGTIADYKRLDWIVYTDSDVELNPLTPKNFVEDLVVWAERHNFGKCGLALKIDDLPQNAYTQEVRNWESNFWKEKLEENVFVASVDTTFCIIKPRNQFDYRAIRVAGDYTARHMPWYVNFNNLSEEELYFLENSSQLSTYRRLWLKHKN